MKTQARLGSFISVMLTLAEFIRQTASVVHHPQSEMAPLLPIMRLMTLNLSRPEPAEDSPSCRVFRFSNSLRNTTPPFSPPLLLLNAQKCCGERTHSALKRRAN